jgi:hypothetical protein
MHLLPRSYYYYKLPNIEKSWLKSSVRQFCRTKEDLMRLKLTVHRAAKAEKYLQLQQLTLVWCTHRWVAK